MNLSSNKCKTFKNRMSVKKKIRINNCLINFHIKNGCQNRNTGKVRTRLATIFRLSSLV